MNSLLIAASVVLGALRLAGCVSPAFQAVAHCFTGGLFGAYLVGRDRLHLWLAVGLSVLETFAFLATRVFHLF